MGSKKAQSSTVKRIHQSNEPHLIVKLVDIEPIHKLRQRTREDYIKNNRTNDLGQCKKPEKNRPQKTHISTIKRKQQLTCPQLVVNVVSEPMHKLRQRKQEDNIENNRTSDLGQWEKTDKSRSEKTHISPMKQNQQLTCPQLVVNVVSEPIHKVRQRKLEDYIENNGTSDFGQCKKPEKTHISTFKQNQQLTRPQLVANVVSEPIYKLRQKKREDYNENSSLTITEEPSEEKHIPIYRTKLPERSKPATQGKDLYDFTDTSPKVKVKNSRRSSIIFDKNTFEILQKLQEKENKLKKMARRKRKRTYGEKVNEIVSNMKQKIAKRIRDEPNKCQQHKTTSNQQELDKPPRRDKCVVNVKNFEKELNILANLTTVSEREETNSTTEYHNIENPQDNEDVSDTTVEEVGAFNTQDLDLMLLQSIGDNSVILKDLESGFGFDNDPPSPSASTPVKNIRILSNKLLRPACKSFVESPVNFYRENPNANSTMVQAGATASPWRTNWINVRRNPHLLSFKTNALPTVDQEMVLDHSIVENYERHCSKRQPQQPCSVKTTTRQKSILDFVESNIDKENYSNLQGSLYDYEDFNSPEKTSKIQQTPVQSVKRKVLGELNNISAQRNLTDPVAETKIEATENTTNFGFDQSTCSSPPKNQQNDKALPSRFNLSNLKQYTRAGRTPQLLPPEESALSDDISENVSINSSAEDAGELQLFEDPERMFNEMESFSGEDRKLKRKRLHSFEMDDSNQRFKRKMKKTKLEMEQEAWIEDFNKRCEDIDSSALEIE